MSFFTDNLAGQAEHLAGSSPTGIVFMWPPRGACNTDELVLPCVSDVGASCTSSSPPLPPEPDMPLYRL